MMKSSLLIMVMYHDVICINFFQDALILHLKQQIEAQHDHHPPPYRQRLVFTDSGKKNSGIQ